MKLPPLPERSPRRISRRRLLAGALGSAGTAALARSPVADSLSQAITGHSLIPSVAAATRNPDLRWQVPGYGIVEFSSITALDIDGDGQLEIIGGTTRRSDKPGSQGYTQKAGVYIFKPNGTLVQVVEPRGGGPIQGSVALGRLLSPTGDLYLVIPVGAEVADFRFNGGIQAFRLNPATKRFDFAFEFRTRDDLMGGSRDGLSDPVHSTPCLADVDNDGVLEVFFGSWDRWIYLIKPTPQGFVKLWDYANNDTIWSSGVAADVDGDGFLELIIGADISNDNDSDPEDNADGGYLLCFDRNGNRRWRNFYPEALYSSPAVADIDGDGKLEVVIGSSDSHGWTERGGNVGSQQFVGNFVVCVEAATGREKWRFTTNGHGWSSPALGNFLGKTNPTTGAPTLQVVATSIRYEGEGSPSNPSEAYLIDSDGREVWRRRPKDYLGKTNFLRASPAVADINGDGRLEALIPVLWDVAVFDAAGNQIDIYHTPYSLFSTPCVADVDGDGKLEMFIACSSADQAGGQPQNDRAWVYGWRLPAAASAARPWPMFRQNPARTGSLARASSAPFNYAVNFSPGQGRASVLIPGSSDRSTAFTTTATNSYRSLSGANIQVLAANPSWLTVTPLQNAGPAVANLLRVELDGRQMTNPGVYQISLRLRPTDAGASLSPGTVDLAVTVAPRHVHVPVSAKR